VVTGKARTPRDGGRAGRFPLVSRAVADDTPSDGEVVPLADTFVSASGSPYEGKRALVFGATGGTGKEIVKECNAQGIPCSLFVRSKQKAQEMFDAEIETGAVVNEVFEGDVSKYEDVLRAVENSGCNCIMVATGCRPALDPLGPFQVDYSGTANIVSAANRQGASVEHVVLVTSIGVDDIFFPLNLFFGVLFWKKRAEETLQRSGSNYKYTIVRPGGLQDEPKGSPGAVRLGPADTYGLPPRKAPGSILRSQVAEICVSSLAEEAAFNKTIECVAANDEPALPIAEQLEAI